MSDGQVPHHCNYKSPTPDQHSDSADESVVAAAAPTTAPNTEQLNDPPSHTACSSVDSLAKGISSTLVSVIKGFDSRAEDAISSQDNLSFAIDRLTRELDQLLEDAPLPFIMQHAAKISGVRKRVASLNLLLKSIQRRVDNMDRMLCVGLPHGSPDADLGVRDKRQAGV
ncbi:uncharacterized protein LOC131145021 [Malania oleifera]|uniref:uncharacterized protein LOC131145021 n=1 Tax=Malania oleifera TaxID=397392 RepID=UPI0025AE1D10|nr:uncharacterized protein LOC131145021 [Malania oleifera]XP_057950032.1 uncharacterized protein LOC131145021 [Malania oleifera]